MPRSNRPKPREWIIEEFDGEEWWSTAIYQHIDDNGKLLAQSLTVYKENQRMKLEDALDLFAKVARAGVTLAESFRTRNIKTGEIIPFELFE